MNIDQQLAYAQQLLSRRDVNTAYQRLLELERQSPFNPIVLTHLVGITLAKHHEAQAEVFFERWMEPQCVITDVGLAQHMLTILHSHSLLRWSIKAANKVRQSFPTHAELIGKCVTLCREARANQMGLQWLSESEIDINTNPGLLRLRANLLSMLGHFAAATTDYQHLLTQNPLDSYAIAGLAKSRRFSHKDEDVLAAMQKARLACGHASERARIGYAIAKVFNDYEDYEQAWQVATQANAEKRTTCYFDAQQFKRQVDGLIAGFEQIDWQKHCSSSEMAHVFVVGMPRSGTTLIEQILSVVPGFYAGGETPAIESALGSVENANQYLHQLQQGKDVDFNAIAKSYEAYFREFDNFSGRLLINKVPTNFFHIGLIKLMFPKAKIINMERNPLDLAASIYFENFSEHFAYTNDLEDIFFVYDQYQRLMEHWRGMFGGDILDVSYQSLVEDYAAGVSTVGEFLGATMPSVETIRASKNPVETPSIWQVRQPINNSAVDRWKHYEDYLTQYYKRYN